MIHVIPNNNPKSEFSHFEISPVAMVDADYCTACDQTSNETMEPIHEEGIEPHCWGVYGRLFEKDGEAVHIVDRETQGGALDFVRMLNGSIQDHDL